LGTDFEWGQTFQIASAANRISKPIRSAGKCGQICGSPIPNIGFDAATQRARNVLMSQGCALIGYSCDCMVQVSPPASYMFPEQSWRYSEAFCFAKCKMPFSCAIGLGILQPAIQRL
jgi:hypothetical protein